MRRFALALTGWLVLCGAGFYHPPARMVRHGLAGTPIATRAAGPLVARPPARRTFVLVYRSRSVGGARTAMSASVALPKSAPPWDTVVFDHVTTGAADRCAPSRVTAKNTERERMTRADALVDRLLGEGIAVIRPDDEGIGTRGPHPYSIGRSLARGNVDALRAARRVVPRLTRRWAIAGHSEGGVGSLFTGALARRMAPGLDLRAVAAAAPPSHITTYFKAGRNIPTDEATLGGLSALAGLFLGGAAAADPHLGTLYRHGALSDRAVALLPHLERRCLNDLSRKDSWGGLAPGDIPGPNADAAFGELYRVLDANDPLAARIDGLPVRIDQGGLDAVVPVALTEDLVRVLRERGTDVTYTRYPGATHVTITDIDQAGAELAGWLADHLR